MCCDRLTIVIREAHAQVSFLDLLNEHIFLVEEEYDGGGGEVAVVADTVEQVQTLVHTILKKVKGVPMRSLFHIDELLVVWKKGLNTNSPTTSSSSTSTMS